jgi:hypothetical protein
MCCLKRVMSVGSIRCQRSEVYGMITRSTSFELRSTTGTLQEADIILFKHREGKEKEILFSS